VLSFRGRYDSGHGERMFTRNWPEASESGESTYVNTAVRARVVGAVDDSCGTKFISAIRRKTRTRVHPT
jgi:hypothetical protein